MYFDDFLKALHIKCNDCGGYLVSRKRTVETHSCGCCPIEMYTVFCDKCGDRFSGKIDESSLFSLAECSDCGLMRPIGGECIVEDDVFICEQCHLRNLEEEIQEIDNEIER
jgi:hypothetical protein